MSESLAGLIVAITRQNAGRAFAEAGGVVAPGGTKAPAATCSAEVIVVSASFSVARLSQVAAKAGAAAGINANATSAMEERRKGFKAEAPEIHLFLFRSSIAGDCGGCSRKPP
jgi:hypothetical protein